MAGRTILYDAPDLTSEDSEINFQGFGSYDPNLDDTLPLASSKSQAFMSFDVSLIRERPPEQLFKEHDSLSRVSIMTAN